MWKRAWIIWKNNTAGGAEPQPHTVLPLSRRCRGWREIFYASLCCIYASSVCASTEFVVRANASPIVRQLGGESSGAAFRRKRLYAVMVRFVVPVMMLILFLQSTGIMA